MIKASHVLLSDWSRENENDAMSWTQNSHRGLVQAAPKSGEANVPVMQGRRAFSFTDLFDRRRL